MINSGTLGLPAAASCFVGNLEEKAPHAFLYRRPLPGLVKFGQTAPTPPLHLIDSSDKREPTGPPMGDVGRSCYFFSLLSLGNIMSVFFRWIHRGVASEAQAATEKTVTDWETSLLPQQLCEPRFPVGGATFHNKLTRRRNGPSCCHVQNHAWPQTYTTQNVLGILGYF